MFSEFIASVAGFDKLCDSLEDESQRSRILKASLPFSTLALLNCRLVFSNILLMLKRYV